jgi:hypothetical protein
MLLIPTFEDALKVLGIQRDSNWSDIGLRGEGFAELRDEYGDLKELVVFHNLITDIGDNYYMERASGISSPPNQVTGMKLGTGTTAVSKSGAGAAIVTYAGTGVTASKAIDSTWPQATTGVPGCQIQWKVSWSAGQVTVNNLAEVVVSNETSLADDAGTASNTISRALLSPTISKGASDTLAITWNHLGLGS